MGDDDGVTPEKVFVVALRLWAGQDPLTVCNVCARPYYSAAGKPTCEGCLRAPMLCDSFGPGCIELVACDGAVCPLCPRCNRYMGLHNPAGAWGSED